MGRRHSIDTHKTKFLRKKQGGDIQSILAPKSARKRHSIDTRNRMSKEATFHRYLQYHSAGRRLLVDTCIFENQKPGFHAKTRLLCQKPGLMPKTKIWLPCQQNKNLAFMPKIKKSGFHANKTKLGFQKTWLLCHKIWLLRQTNKNRLSCHKTKLGFHATKIGSHAKNRLSCQTKLGFHATKIGSHAKNRLSCQTKLGFHATKIGSHAKNQAFCHKIWLSCLKTTI